MHHRSFVRASYGMSIKMELVVFLCNQWVHAISLDVLFLLLNWIMHFWFLKYKLFQVWNDEPFHKNLLYYSLEQVAMAKSIHKHPLLSVHWFTPHINTNLRMLFLLYNTFALTAWFLCVAFRGHFSVMMLFYVHSYCNYKVKTVIKLSYLYLYNGIPLHGKIMFISNREPAFHM